MSATSPPESLIHHVRSGQPNGQPPVLLLNGGMMTAGSWQPIADGLGEGDRIGCDFRGQLLSPGDGHPTLEAHARDVLALLDHLHIDAVRVIGTSFGGEVGLVLAATAPERVESLLAFTATDVTTDSMRRGVKELQRLVSDILDGEAEASSFYDFLFDEIHSRAYLETNAAQLAERKALSSGLPQSWYRGLLGILDCTLGIDVRPLLGQIRCPTTILGAAEDLVMPIEHSHALAEGIDGATLEIHPSAGHALILEDPAWLIERCRRFLNA